MKLRRVCGICAVAATAPEHWFEPRVDGTYSAARTKDMDFVPQLILHQ